MIKVFVQIELGRYAITHGKTTLAAFDTLPGPRLGTSWMCWLWLFMMLTTQAQIAAMEGLVGQAAHMAFPGASARGRRASPAGSIPAWGTFLDGHPEYFWATLTALAAIALLLSGGYKRLEQVTTVLVATVTLITVACVAGPALDRAIRISARRASQQGFDSRPPGDGGGAGVLDVRDHRRRGQRAVRLSLLVHREGLRPRTPGPRSPDEGWAARARGWLG